VEIFGRFASEAQYTLGEGTPDTLRSIFAGAGRDDSFGNARFARTLFEQGLNAQALRLGEGDVERLSEDELKCLTPADLLAGARTLGEEPPAPRTAWFGRRR